MNIKSLLFQKKNLWHVGIIALFFIISAIYMSPNLSGYTVKQTDIVNFVGMSREIQDYRENGEQVLWTNSMFSGMPSTQISVKYEGNWFAQGLKKVVALGLPYPLAFLFIYFIGFYILGLSLRIKPYISALGSIAFGLSSYFLIIIEAGHNSKAGAIGFIPIMIAGFILTYRSKKYILAAGFAAVGMMLELAANHIQITYYVSFLLLFLGIIELVKVIKDKGNMSNFIKRTTLLLVGYGLALLVNYGNIFGTLDYTKQTIRGGSELTITADGTDSKDQVNEKGLDKDYVTNWSYGLGETFTFLVPNFKGGVSQPLGANEANRDYIRSAPSQFRKNLSTSAYQYWGDQPFTSGPVYIGIIVVFLAFLALVYVKDKYKWAFLSAILLAICLSWGKNFVSALILIPILLYLANVFIEDSKKRMAFNIINSVLILVILITGNSLVNISLTDLFLDYLPGYNKLRAVTIILVVAELCIPILGILFLNSLIKSKDGIAKNIKPLLIVSGTLLLLLIIFYVSPTTFNSFLGAQELSTLASIEDPNQLAGYEAFFDELVKVRQSIFKADVARSLLFLVVGAGLIFAFLKLNLNKFLFIGVLAIFIFADLFTVDQRYLATEKKGRNYEQWTEKYKQVYPFNQGDAESEILRQEIALNPSIQTKIEAGLADLKVKLKAEGASNAEMKRQADFLRSRVLNRNSNFRVLEVGNSFNSSYVGYFNKSIGGYHGAKLSRYQDLIEFHLSKNNQAVLDMLNTKYLLQTERNNRNEIVNSKLVNINPNAMGNAWLTKKVQFVENANEEILAMSSEKSYRIVSKGNGQILVDGKPIENVIISSKQSIAVVPSTVTGAIPVNIPFQALQNQELAAILDSNGVNWVYNSTPDSVVQKLFTVGLGSNNGWDPRETTLVDTRFKAEISQSNYSGSGTIKMTSYHPEKITYQFNSTQKELAVFSEVYYQDGWTAYVDKQPTPISRVNYVLRALDIPAGDHQIEFIYESKSFEKAGLLANIGNIGIILLLIGGVYFEFVKQKPEASHN